MAGYTRQDSDNNISNGSVINADDFDAEYNAVEAAFNSSTGHKHDGSAGEGAPIEEVGPAQDLVVSSSQVLPKTTNTLDLGSASVQFKNAWFDGTVDTDALTVSANTTMGGTLSVSANTTMGGTLSVTGTITGNLTGNVTGNVTGTVSDVSNHDTNDITEGSTNLYHTTARARASISGSGSLSYNSTTGEMSFTQGNTDTVAEGSTNLYYTDARARAAISVTDSGGDGSLSYSNGVITYTGPSATEVRAHLSAGTGVSYSNGQFSIGQPVGISADVTFGNAIVQNLTVNGTTTTVNSNDVNIADSTLTLNSDETGAPSQDAGIVIERGTSSNVSFLWDESEDKWTTGGQTIVASLEGSASTLATSRTIQLTGGVTGSVSFDGSANASITATVTDDSHTHDGRYYTETESDSLFTASAGDVMTGNLRFDDNVIASFGSSDDAEFFCDGSHMYMDLNSGIGNFYIRDGSTTKFTFDDNGAFTAAGDVTAYSDVRLKDNIETIDGALDKVSAMRGVTFDKDGQRSTGVIAQEMQEVMPEVVQQNEEYLSVAYGNLVGVLIEAVKELRAEVEELKKGQ